MAPIREPGTQFQPGLEPITPAKGHPARRPCRPSAPRTAAPFRPSSHCPRSRSHSAKSPRPFGQVDFGVIVLYITYPETLSKYLPYCRTAFLSYWPIALLPYCRIARLPYCPTAFLPA